MAWRFNESSVGPLQNFNAIGLNETDVIELTQAFHVCGFWRVLLQDGMLFWTENIFKIFEMEPHCGPINFQTAINKIHPDDRTMMLDAFQRSCESKQTYQSIYRVLSESGSVKWVRSVGKHHVNQNGQHEIRGMLHELLQQSPTVAFAVDATHELDR